MPAKTWECALRMLRWTRNNVFWTQRTIDPSSNQRDSCGVGESGSAGTVVLVASAAMLE